MEEDPAVLAARETAAALIQTSWRAHKKAFDSDQPADDDNEEEEKHAVSRNDALLEEYGKLHEEFHEVLSKNATLQSVLHARFEDKYPQIDAPMSPLTSLDAAEAYITALSALSAEQTALTTIERDHHVRASELKDHVASLDDAAGDFDAKLRAFCNGLLLGVADPAPLLAEGAQVTNVAQQQWITRIREAERVEREKEADWRDARMAFVKARNSVRRLTASLRQHRQQVEGYYAIDFEQLKIENATMNERIEERNEDLLRMRRKATTTIHVLTHVKEKLTFCQTENAELREHLASLDAQLTAERDELGRNKRERDAAQSASARMRHAMPLVGAHDLLVDFERRTQDLIDLRSEVSRLKQRHHDQVAFIASVETLYRQQVGMSSSGAVAAFTDGLPKSRTRTKPPQSAPPAASV